MGLRESYNYLHETGITWECFQMTTWAVLLFSSDFLNRGWEQNGFSTFRRVRLWEMQCLKRRIAQRAVKENILQLEWHRRREVQLEGKHVRCKRWTWETWHRKCGNTQYCNRMSQASKIIMGFKLLKLTTTTTTTTKKGFKKKISFWIFSFQSSTFSICPLKTWRLEMYFYLHFHFLITWYRELWL